MNLLLSSLMFILPGSASNQAIVRFMPSLKGIRAEYPGTNDFILELSNMTLQDLSPNKLPRIHPCPKASAASQIKSDEIWIIFAFTPMAAATAS